MSDYPRVCRNGHEITGPGGEHWGEHRQCYRCRLDTQRDAQHRYKGTAKGMLADVRYQTGQAKLNLEVMLAGLSETLRAPINRVVE